MKYLAIDTSGDYLTVICNNQTKSVIRYLKLPGVKHSLTLMPTVEEAQQKAQLDFNEVDFFCAVTGPGSFTGIRIGVATIKALADSFKKPVLAVTTFDAIAYNESSGKFMAVINANHGNFYVQGYDDLCVTYQAEFINKDRLLELSKEYKLLVYGPIDGVLAKVVDPSQGLKNAVESLHYKKTDDVNMLHPFYLRLSQAEEGRK